MLGAHCVEETDVVVNLLWTGGWDSTFRLLQLVLEEKTRVQTHYVLDERSSLQEELEAMRRIRHAVLDRDEGNRLLFPPTLMYDYGQFSRSPFIQKIYKQATERMTIAPQYLRLANVAEQIGWYDMEMCLVRGESTTLKRELFVSVPECNEDPEPTLSGSDVASLFRYASFPLLGWSKVDIVNAAEEAGHLDILQEAWFCFSPVAGRACGYCRPCRIAAESGRPVQFSRIGTVRHYYRRGRTALAKKYREMLRT